MSVASEINRISQNISGAMTAIANKGVTVPAGSTSDDLADLISEIETGGSSTGESGALFIDYDGTELYNYTTAQALALNALPANPTHTGLTAQGWNWSLANIKAYLTKYPNAMVVVGQMYITDDGKTRIYIHLGEERKSPMVGICINGSVDVDWGDGTAHDTLIGSSTDIVVFTQNHNYATGGDYVIKLTVTGEATFSGYNLQSGGAYLLRFTDGTDYRNVYYNSVIKSIEIGNNIQSLLDNAFSNNCSGLETVTIPQGINNIGQSAFAACKSLKSITFPKGITTIKTSAVSFNTSIKNISIPDSVTIIESQAFYSCTALKNITIPDGITVINSYLLNGCSNLDNLTIPDTVTEIKDYAFYYCSKLKKIIIPNGVSKIGIAVFQFLGNIESIDIPESVTSIGDLAFSSMFALKSIIIPNGITKISGSLFLNCTALENITIPSSVTSIGSSAFQGCRALKDITIPSGVKSIGSKAFYECYSLKSITIPQGITQITDYLFYNCSNLREITIPTGVTSIAQYAFQQCYFLTKITIPSGVTSIGKYAFYNNYSMLEIHLLPTNPPTLGDANAFSNIQADCKIYVPVGSLTSYQSATKWANWAVRMEEEPAT